MGFTHDHLADFDPALVVASDLANLAVAGAYMVGFPFCTWRLFPVIPVSIRAVYVLGVLFVYSFGLGHFLDIIVTHKASYLIYALVIAEDVLTGIVSWAFVLAVLNTTRRAGLRVVADDVPGAGDVPKAPTG